MARARNIKPGFFENEVLAECSAWARLCFAGLWTLADRAGRLEDRPRRIKGDLFRYDSIEVEPLLQELEAHGFLLRYENEDGRFIQILTFEKHQTPHYNEKRSVIRPPAVQECAVHGGVKSLGQDQDKPESPPPTGEPESPGQDLDKPETKLVPLPPDSLIPDSLIPEEDGGTVLRTLPPSPPDFDGSNGETLNGRSVVKLAAGWELPDQWGLDAEALGWKPREVLQEAEKFRQYWTAGKGAGTRRAVKGWRQSWSNWMAKAAEAKR